MSQIEQRNLAQITHYGNAAVSECKAARSSGISHRFLRLQQSATPETSLPDTGFQPWLQVVAGFFLMFNAWGIIFSFGTFQTYYTSHDGLSDTSSPSTIAWIGSVQTFLLLCIGAISGVHFDKGYFRQMIMLGTFMIVFGMMMLSLATHYYQALLSQGFCVGVGMGLLLVPSVGLPSTWFNKNRGVAVGIVSSGASGAGIVLPILVRKLITGLGFPWAARILGMVSLLTLIISVLLAKQRLPPRQRGKFVEYSALKQVEFAVYITGLFVSMFGFYTFYNFVEAWVAATNIDTKAFNTVYILPILNAASIIGRIIPAYCSDFLGPLNIQTPALGLCGILVLAWIGVDTLSSLIVLVLMYGVASGAVIALPPVVVASMTEDLTNFGGKMGVFFLAISCSSLAGQPINGAIIQSGSNGYTGARIFSGTLLLAGAVLLCSARMIKTKGKIWVWA